MMIPGKILAESVCCSFIVLWTCWFQEISKLRLFVPLTHCCQHDLRSRKDLSWDCLVIFHSVVTIDSRKVLSWDDLLLLHRMVNILVLGKIWVETVCCSSIVLWTCWFQVRSKRRLFVALSQCWQHVGSRKDLSWGCLLHFHSVVSLLVQRKIWGETVYVLLQCCQHVSSRKDLHWDCLLLFHSVVSMLVLLLLLLPIVVHPSVDRVFSNYVKCTCAVRERLCRFKNSLCTV